MSLRDVSQTFARGAIPHCLLCHNRLGVRPLVRQWATDGVRYWTCDNCMMAWASRDGETLTSTAADRTPRKST
jgi:hypothetical protein